MKKINITIDGFSSTGKSTLAKALPQKLQYTYIDSGAMYRAITLYILENNFNLQDETLLKKALADIQLEFRGKQIFLNNKNVDQAIRSMKVAEQVSQVATIPMIRDFCVAQQQAFGIKKGVVMGERGIQGMPFEFVKEVDCYDFDKNSWKTLNFVSE